MYPPTATQEKLKKQLDLVQVATLEDLGYCIVILAMKVLDFNSLSTTTLNAVLGTIHSTVNEIENRIGEAMKTHIRRSTADPFRDFIRKHNI